MSKFKGLYRSESHRKQNWDYGSNGYYFVTICTQDRECFFGSITNGKMTLSEIGEIAQKFWLEIPNHFEHVRLHNYIVMPNHVHGIIEIDKKLSDNARPSVDRSSSDDTSPSDGTYPSVDTPPSVDTQPTDGTRPSVNTPNLGVSTDAASQKWKPGILGVIINQYKRICTINARKINPKFAWQRNYHDHIIRNNVAMAKIAYYIDNNPEKWTADRFNPRNN